MAVTVHVSNTDSKHHPEGSDIQIDAGHLLVWKFRQRIAIYAPEKWIRAEVEDQKK